MQTSLMQRLALSGLFMTVREGMQRTRNYGQMPKGASPLADGSMQYNYVDQIAIWQTSISPEGAIIWTLQFKDDSLGGLSAGWGEESGISFLHWILPGVYAFDKSSDSYQWCSEGEIYFEPNEFARLFEELRRTCAVYMKYHGFTNCDNYSAFTKDVLDS